MLSRRDYYIAIKEQSKRKRKAYASRGILEFGRVYFPQYFTLPSPKVHLDIYRELEEITKPNLKHMTGYRKAYALPRGCAKSTILDFLFPLYCICFQIKKYLLIISASQTLANVFLEAIKDELEFNEQIIEDFGHLKGDLWRADAFLTSTGIKVEALGAGTKIRGRKNGAYRPDLVVFDDLETDEGVRSAEQRKKLSDWFFKACLKVGTPKTDFVFLGTVLHHDALLVNVLHNPTFKAKRYSAVLSFAERQDLWQEWEEVLTDLNNPNRLDDAKAFYEANKQAMDEGVEVLWEDKYSYYDLMLMKCTEGVASFNTEMMNIPQSEEDMIFNPSWFSYFNIEDINVGKLDLFMALDIALGKSNGDFTALTVLGLDKKTGQMYVIESIVKRLKPDMTIKLVCDTVKFYKDAYKKLPKVLGVETVAFQSYFKDNLRKELMQKGLYVNIQGLKNTENKLVRIERLQPEIRNGYIKFQHNQKLLLEQLEQYPKGKHDDAPDSLEMARRLASKVAGGLIQK